MNVLIVDDDEMVIYLHEIMVKGSTLSANPLAFMNGKEALDYLEADNQDGQACLILLDINMPVMNGWELLDAINSRNFANKIFVVIVTSSVDSADRAKAGTYRQVIDYVEKPITVEALEKVKSFI